MRERNRDRQGADVQNYLITFTSYGTWLPGTDGAVDRRHNAFGSRFQKPDLHKEERAARLLKEDPYLLDDKRRSLVLNGIRHCCEHRKWYLFAAHVRTTHVHVVVQADRSPEHVLTALKAYASRVLNSDEKGRQKRWARHGSTRYLRTPESRADAIRYVVHEQGHPMAVFVA